MFRTSMGTGGKRSTSQFQRYLATLEHNDLMSLTDLKASEEMVLADPSGLHMGAGPYLLLYSRHIPQDRIKAPLPWPKPYVVR